MGFFSKILEGLKKTKQAFQNKIKYIFTTGNKAYELYNKYQYPITKIKAYKLPSPSPANCKKGIDDILYNSYMQIKDILSENWSLF